MSTKKSKRSSTSNKAQKHKICCICLESISPTELSTLDSCEHSYHHDCIVSWSRIENACPLCKTKFTSISNEYLSKSITVSERKQEAAYHIELGNIIWVDCVCIMCGCDDNEELLLLCDGCDAPQHTYCAGLGDTVPTGDFYCDACKSKIGDLLELGLSPDMIFTNSSYHSNNTNTQHSHNHNSSNNYQRSESILDTYDDQSHHENDSDEEYVPSPQRKRRAYRMRARPQKTKASKKATSSRTAATQTSKSRKSSKQTKRSVSSRSRRSDADGAATDPDTMDESTASLPTSDEEYVPYRQMRAKRGIRRSERLRNIQQRAATPDLDGIENEQEREQTENERRARSASPVSRTRKRQRATPAAQSTLSGLPSSPHIATVGVHDGTMKKTAFVLDQNGKKHRLGIHRSRPSCLNQLFDASPIIKHRYQFARNYPIIETSKYIQRTTGNVRNNTSPDSMCSVSTKSILSMNHSDDSSSAESPNHEIQENDKLDGDGLFIPKSTKQEVDCVVVRSMKRKASLSSLSVVKEHRILSDSESVEKDSSDAEEEEDDDVATENQLDTDCNDDVTESDYMPSDTHSELSDTVSKRRPKRSKPQRCKIRKSQRLMAKKLKLLQEKQKEGEQEEAEEQQSSTDDERDKYHRKNRKRAFTEIEDGERHKNIAMSHRKRAKHSHIRKYSCLSNL